MSRKPVAVIILNWNGERLLREYLPSIIANNPDSIADVIVADNGSADGSLALLAEESGRLLSARISGLPRATTAPYVRPRPSMAIPCCSIRMSAPIQTGSRRFTVSCSTIPRPERASPSCWPIQTARASSMPEHPAAISTAMAIHIAADAYLIPSRKIADNMILPPRCIGPAERA